MLDPLSAIGLAGNIVQFVDFGLDILTEATEIRRKGSSVKVAHLQKVTSDLVQIATSLRKPAGPGPDVSSGLQEEEEVHSSMAHAEVSAADTLMPGSMPTPRSLQARC